MGETTASRRAVRTRVFELVFERAFHTQDEPLSFEADEDPKVTAMINALAERLTEIDAIIKENLKGWRLERINRVALAVLRVGVYELCFAEKTPVGVVVNEAVELAKTYGGADCPRFVNGVLGSVGRSVHTQTARQASAQGDAGQALDKEPKIR
jgi:N utilization substance protein B